MDYTEITKFDIAERDRACRGIRSDRPLRTPENAVANYRKDRRGDALHTGNSISYFCYHLLGIKPYVWQDKFWREMIKNERDLLACTPRQVGKSFAISVAALHSAVYNLYPIRSKGNKTVIGIVSKSDKQSKHIISGIRELMYMGDDYLADAYNGEFRDFFKNRLSNKQIDTNNKTHLTFREPELNEDGEWEAIGKVIGEIICIPATDSARGFTFSKLFMDEAAFFEDDDFFTAIAEPTLRATKGHAVVTTTPNGQRGWFFEVFDPFDEKFKVNPYYRMWLHYSHIEDEAEKVSVLKKRETYQAQGRIKRFEQEYEASFTVDAISFFDPNKVDGMFDSTMTPWDSYDKPTDLGLDVGFKQSRSVITISRLTDDGEIHRIWHKVYPEKDDLSIVPDILNLIPRYNIQRVIVDDCPAASAILQQLNKESINVKLMNFKTDKTRKYIQFRSKLNKGLIKSYKDIELSSEMKSLEEYEGMRMTRIEKPKRGRDDRIDSFVISSYFFIEEKRGIHVYDLDDY